MVIGMQIKIPSEFMYICMCPMWDQGIKLVCSPISLLRFISKLSNKLIHAKLFVGPLSQPVKQVLILFMPFMALLCGNNFSLYFESLHFLSFKIIKIFN